MKVSDLMELLECCDPEAKVRIMSQEGWPFENKVRGVAVRFEFPGEDCECDHRIDEPHEKGCPALDDAYPEGCAANDVFIVEGDQERYGNKAAWEVHAPLVAGASDGRLPQVNACENPGPPPS